MAVAGSTILLMSLLFTAGAETEQTRTRDPYIVCPGRYVPDNAHGLPAGYSAESYFNVMQLCSALNGNARNVGCVCSSPQVSSFHCWPGVADNTLFRARVRPSRKTFPAFCKESCFCTDEDTAAEAQAQQDYAQQYPGTGPTNQQEDVDYFDPNDADYQIHQADGESQGGNQQNLENPGDGWEVGLNGNSVPTTASGPEGECWSNCTSIADCLKSGEKGCMCSTQSEQYQPGSGMVAFAAACIISMSRIGGKRQETSPCPCNATYVSHACCGVADGLVWEAAHFKLGELLYKDKG